MSMTDPIADMLTRIRNASRAGHKRVSVPASRVKRQIACILQEHHYIRGFTEQETDNTQNDLVLRLRYTHAQDPVITGIRRLSTPGRRQYVGRDRVKAITRQLGVTVLTTSRGIMTSHQASEEGIGGELLCRVW